MKKDCHNIPSLHTQRRPGEREVRRKPSPMETPQRGPALSKEILP